MERPVRIAVVGQVDERLVGDLRQLPLGPEVRPLTSVVGDTEALMNFQPDVLLVRFEQNPSEDIGAIKLLQRLWPALAVGVVEGEARYADEPFVDVMPQGSHPETRFVKGSNHCRLAIHRPGGGDVLAVLSVIDNLVKGASGQAIQCMNLMFGLEETAGIDLPALLP